MDNLAIYLEGLSNQADVRVILRVADGGPPIRGRIAEVTSTGDYVVLQPDGGLPMTIAIRYISRIQEV